MKFYFMLIGVVIVGTMISGCGQSSPDNRVVLGDGVGTDTAASNVITRPIGAIISEIFGDGIDIKNVDQFMNDSGYQEVHISGYNRSYKVKQFEYKFVWLDSSGRVLNTKTSVWQKFSAAPHTNFSVVGVAPRKEAVNFRMDTRNRF